LIDQTDDEIEASLDANFNSIVDACDLIFAKNRTARVCVIGSESGYRGSFDEGYAAAKRQMHHYIKTFVPHFPQQQLVGISPSIIIDTKMTESRKDIKRLNARMQAHPMKRWLLAREVAAMAHFLLFNAPYCNGTVVRMHGGQGEET
jgi:NAD(P)-dependent dehydrogenase (short-subunit alcohol dehydrogenase family)